jgi:hypothetical protein
MTHGAVPYIMATAMMYVSPTEMAALIEGIKRNAGTVNSAKPVSIAHRNISGGDTATCQAAQRKIGSARKLNDII